MSEDRQVSRGKRRPLPSSNARLHLLSRSCVFLVALLLAARLRCHEAARVDSFLNPNNEKPFRRTFTYLDNNERIIRRSQQAENQRYLRRRNANPAQAAQQQVPMERTLGEPSQQDEHVPEKPSLEHTANAPAPQRNESRFSINLSVAVVDSVVNASNGTYVTDTVSAIVNALDTIIVNDTDYELHSSVMNNATAIQDTNTNETQSSSWVYTLKLNNSTAKEYENSTECLVHGSNETISVTFVKVVVEYYIIPQRRYMNDTAQNENNNDTHLQQGGEHSDQDSEDNVFDLLDPLLAHDETETERSNGHSWDFVMVGSTVVNATRDRIVDGSILEWIQQQDLSVVGVAQVGRENLTRCIVVDANPELDVPIPFIDPLDLGSWDALQMLGSIMFLLTIVGTCSLCFIGRNRSKAVRVEEWSAMIGNESAVNDFLTLSSRFLPPECISQRDRNAAMLVTIPGAEQTESPCLIHADDAACHGPQTIESRGL